MKIDTHQHFWRYRADECGWIWQGMEVLEKDFLPEHLAPLLKSTGMDGTVAVQARQSLEESRWLLELADQNPLIKGVVGWVDLRSPEVEEQLGRFALHPKFVGVRHLLEDEPDARFMMREDFIRGIGKLAGLHLTYDLQLLAHHLSVACELVEKFPGQPFVLDHLSKPLIKDRKRSPWDAEIRRLAAFPNVYCKVSGMVTEADWKSWKPADFTPYLDVIFECFGTDRIMIGSDWPVCTLAGSYRDVIQIAADYLERLASDEKSKVWSENAERFYGISDS